MKNYKEFILKFTPFNIDLVSGGLWDYGIIGINEYDDHISAFVYEDSDLDSVILDNYLKTLVKEKIIDSFSFEIKELENKNWNEEWEKKINVLHITDRIVIKPSFRDYEANENEVIIEIDPKMSFGTGEHQTTKIVLMLVDKYITKGDIVLDVGSGTGILAIAAIKLGASHAVAVDNDEWCLINGKENAERNNIHNIEIIHGTINDIVQTDFDLTLANINKHILIDIKNDLFGKVKKGGLLILSGILIDDLEEIKRQYSRLGLTALEFHQLDEWIGIVLKKN